jgi:hypothetical protein
MILEPPASMTGGGRNSHATSWRDLHLRGKTVSVGTLLPGTPKGETVVFSECIGITVPD